MNRILGAKERSIRLISTFDDGDCDGGYEVSDGKREGDRSEVDDG